VASYKREKQKRRPQRLLLLRCLLEGGSLAFGEWADEEEPQGPKLVNKRLSSGCDRFDGVTAECIRTCGGAPYTGGPMTYVGPPWGASYV